MRFCGMVVFDYLWFKRLRRAKLEAVFLTDDRLPHALKTLFFRSALAADYSQACNFLKLYVFTNRF